MFVTHDQEEAFEVADRVVVMNRGGIEQVGTPAEVFEQPANDFVMRFLGHVNVLDAELADGRARIGDVTVALGAAPGAAPRAHNGDTRGRVYVRPHEVEIARAPAAGAFAARVVRVTPLSGGLKVELSVPSLGSRLRADLDWERGTALACATATTCSCRCAARASLHDGDGVSPVLSPDERPATSLYNRYTVDRDGISFVPLPDPSRLRDILVAVTRSA